MVKLDLFARLKLPIPESTCALGKELAQLCRANPSDGRVCQVYAAWLELQGRFKEAKVMRMEAAIRSLREDRVHLSAGF